MRLEIVRIFVSSTWLDRELLEQVSAERRRSEGQRRVALDAFYELTYEVPKLLAGIPALAEPRERIVRRNLEYLERLVALNAGDHPLLRELATNWRLLGTTLMDRGAWHEARGAFEQSGKYCEVLVTSEPEEALYHRDLAVSHFNVGLVLEKLKEHAGARRQFELALPASRRAAELDSRWNDERDYIDAHTRRHP